MTAPRAPRTEPGPTINPWRMFQGAFIPNAVLQLSERRLWAGAKICYARLLRYAGKRGVAFPKTATLATETGQSLRTTGRALRALRDVGLITTTQRGRGMPVLIRFHLPADIFGELCRGSALPRVAGQNGSALPRVAGQRAAPAIVHARAVNLSQLKPEVSHRSAGGRPVGRRPVFTERGHTKNQQRLAGLLGGIVKRI